MKLKTHESGGFLLVDGTEDDEIIITVAVDLETHGVTIKDRYEDWRGVGMPLAHFKKFFKQAIREINRYERTLNAQELEEEDLWSN